MPSCFETGKHFREARFFGLRINEMFVSRDISFNAKFIHTLPLWTKNRRKCSCWYGPSVESWHYHKSLFKSFEIVWHDNPFPFSIGVCLSAFDIRKNGIFRLWILVAVLIEDSFLCKTLFSDFWGKLRHGVSGTKSGHLRDKNSSAVVSRIWLKLCTLLIWTILRIGLHSCFQISAVAPKYEGQLVQKLSFET